MSIVEDKLHTLGLQLAEPKAPVANYLSTKLIGDTLYVSARVSQLTGSVGENVSEAEAKTAAEILFYYFFLS